MEQKQKETEDTEEQLAKESNNLEKSSQCSSSHSSDRSSTTTTNVIEIPPATILTRPIQRNRSYSATLRGQRLLPDKPSFMKEIVNNPPHSWDFEDFSTQPDPTGPLTKSALIYRLMRSRLEANLAKSITSNKEKSKHKKKLNSTTTT